jgi:hypothetical protein
MIKWFHSRAAAPVQSYNKYLPPVSYNLDFDAAIISFFLSVNRIIPQILLKRFSK